MFKIGNYVLHYRNDKKTVLFNTYNGAIVEIKNNQIKNKIVDLSNEEENELRTMDFDKNFSEFELKNLYNRPQNIVNLIIELTKNCNLCCAYCYQREWHEDKNKVISDELINKISKLCENILNDDKKIMLLSFIGGEPLLHIDKLISIYKKIKDIAKRKSVKIYVFIDTNGTIFNEKLGEIENLNLNITISCPEDHNMLRNFKTKINCYDIVLQNILLMEKNLKNAKVSLRYNVNDKNINDLDTHINMLIEKGVKTKEMDLAYTVSHNEFVNKLEKKDFYKWLYKDAFSILKKHNFSIRYFPVYSFYPCSAYSKNSFKIHCDGRISLCDSWDIRKANCNIDLIIDNAEKFFQMYKKIKEYSPLKDKKCKNCKYLLLCGGKKFCDNNPCEKFNYIEELILNY